MKQIRRMSIEPAENGGFTVEHSYKPEARKRGGARGDISMEYMEPESHVFGPDDAGKMLAHVAKHLHIPGAKEEAGEPAHKGKK